MKKNSKMSIALTALGLSLAVVASGSAATLDATPSGGWSESEGYFSNQPVSRGFQTASTTSPDSHVGSRESTIDPGTKDVVYAAVGTTVWKNKYHYTTAQIQLSNGTVKTNSGRQWGTGGTYAHSGTMDYWYGPILGQNIEARTYWGS